MQALFDLFVQQPPETSGKAAMVLFLAPKCKHCKKMLHEKRSHTASEQSSTTPSGSGPIASTTDE